MIKEGTDMPKKKILVLVANYPTNSGVSLMYVHVRNKYYLRHGIDVTVLNFKTEENYEIDGIKVISLKNYENSKEQYDTLVSHAANLRNHYKFLKKYEKKFAHLVFFFHGHEVVKLNEVYPKPYDYVKQDNCIRHFMQNMYDNLKLTVWHNYFPKLAYKSDFIFVSQWFCNEAKKYLRLTDADFGNRVHIINNSVGKVFEENTYSYSGEKEYDFITIRSYMDDSKYCVDLVDKLARKYPQYRFLMIGRGQYYELHNVPDNVTWINKFLSHEEIMRYIDQSRCGLLLTREDTQGVMTCELSAYGIPVITSDIDVCKEICGELDNVALISNEVDSVDLPAVYQKLTFQSDMIKTNKYSYNNTVAKEEDIICGRGTNS